ncbi:MAG TPA: CHAP domain-containing protein, partial [Candidatus Saccharimonadales bacterium]|nr:CHAP domain-containing protein [Candidatus Saccharimonadales bacterium]
HRMKLKNKKQNSLIKHLITAPVVIVVALVVIAGVAVPIVRADQFDEQIKALQQQNSGAQATLGDLQAQADSYQDAINRLQTQINALQQVINDNLNEQAKLQQQIDDGQKELARQKQLLAVDIKTMYVDGQPSTLEMLASSSNLSDFVDKEEYRTAVQKKIQVTLKKIQDLQRKLELEKTKIDQLLKDQQNQQAQLADSKTEQDKLLTFNAGQQAAYSQQIKDNKSRIAGLRAQQAAENAKLFAGANVVLGGACDEAHGDTYPSPWCDHSQDTLLDSWGMLNRECVSYTAWKVSESGRNMPGWGWSSRGNANQWDDNAIADGIPVDGAPRAGDVAIKNSQPYGHAMYVESVNSNGTINISQYNADLQGHFSRVYNLSPSGLVFIHF